MNIKENEPNNFWLYLGGATYLLKGIILPLKKIIEAAEIDEQVNIRNKQSLVITKPKGKVGKALISVSYYILTAISLIVKYFYFKEKYPEKEKEIDKGIQVSIIILFFILIGVVIQRDNAGGVLKAYKKIVTKMIKPSLYLAYGVYKLIFWLEHKDKLELQENIYYWLGIFNSLSNVFEYWCIHKGLKKKPKAYLIIHTLRGFLLSVEGSMLILLTNSKNSENRKKLLLP